MRNAASIDRMLMLIVTLTLGGMASACDPEPSMVPPTAASPSATSGPAMSPWPSPAPLSMPAIAPPPRSIPFPDAVAFERAVAGANASPAVPIAGARVVLIPHHWPAGHLALAALRDAAPPPGGWRRAIVLGPDHPNRGATAAATSASDWRSAAGIVRADGAGVAALIGSGAAVRGDALIAAEHGVSGVLPAVRWAMPGALVIPVAVRGDATRAAAARLAAALAPWIDGGTIVVLSVDLSHGLAPSDAARHDAETLAALAALDPERMRGWSDEHLDARGAVRTALALAGRLGATRWVLRERTDGSQLPGYEGGPVTGYAGGYFVRP